MSSSDVYRRVGRGGAGNWYSKKDVEEAEKAQASADLEAQKAAVTPAPATDSAPVYARAGRGGAGNFKDQASAAASIKAEREEAERTKAAVAATAGKARVGLSGRGGVGNWSDSTTPLGAVVQQEEQQKVEDLELKVLKDVEAGLAMPAPAYHHPGPDRETN
ncbi:hypothetical protein QBC34DRAFT_420016 [Podospora aff. communis PSN243]|uniref:Hyaluronan/mRNA-binding protein domain-containing protein n=1 Tax=Podospora aff. communis PSN243 TaxID=3040156 RepID=A0AAV9H881_9PEZI|nr:hypothetical protein QBC34DRAFT_420016 [Podospora aff. communis PSN243]